MVKGFGDCCTLREKQSPVYHSSRYVMYSGDVSFAQRRCSHWAAVWKVLKPKAWTQGPWGSDAWSGIWFQLLESLNITKQLNNQRLDMGGWIWFEHLRDHRHVWEFGSASNLLCRIYPECDHLPYFFSNKGICHLVASSRILPFAHLYPVPWRLAF